MIEQVPKVEEHRRLKHLVEEQSLVVVHMLMKDLEVVVDIIVAWPLQLMDQVAITPWPHQLKVHLEHCPLAAYLQSIQLKARLPLAAMKMLIHYSAAWKVPGHKDHKAYTPVNKMEQQHMDHMVYNPVKHYIDSHHHHYFHTYYCYSFFLLFFNYIIVE